MGSTDPTAAILSVDLGTASTFDPDVFPLAYYAAGDNLSKGSILIRATLKEMEAIKQLGIDLNNNGDFIFNTRVTLEASVLIRSLHMSAHVIVVWKRKGQNYRIIPKLSTRSKHFSTTEQPGCFMQHRKHCIERPRLVYPTNGTQHLYLLNVSPV